MMKRDEQVPMGARHALRHDAFAFAVRVQLAANGAADAANAYEIEIVRSNVLASQDFNGESSWDSRFWLPLPGATNRIGFSYPLKYGGIIERDGSYSLFALATPSIQVAALRRTVWTHPYLLRYGLA
jgi:hypothetical protein